MLNLKARELITQSSIKSEEKHTTVTCKCKKVCITFKDFKPVWHAHCGCADCY